MSFYKEGDLVVVPPGVQVMIQSYDGLDEAGNETYTVTTAHLFTDKDGHLNNVRKAKIIPTLRIL